jgi:hypothetical protein|tara:strand:+ start:2440 stop:2808 length:369 start_codon:yes stop_codon:yes gene_type:complete
MKEVCKPMKTLVIKGKERLWPTVTWADTNLSLLYLGSEDDDVTFREASSIDFEEFFLHLDRGGSIFIMVKPETMDQIERPPENHGYRRALKQSNPDLEELTLEQGDKYESTEWKSEEMRSWR